MKTMTVWGLFKVLFGLVLRGQGGDELVPHLELDDLVDSGLLGERQQDFANRVQLRLTDIEHALGGRFVSLNCRPEPVTVALARAAYAGQGLDLVEAVGVNDHHYINQKVWWGQ